MPLKFAAEDNGNCRVYYRDGHKLYCWQNEGSWGRNNWRFYSCSPDGEPSHEVPTQPVPLPPGEERIGQELIEHLSGPMP